MTLAIRGDQASCLSLRLGPRTWFLAVARGFGYVEGIAMECALLTRLRAECERRLHSARFRRAIDRPQAAATAILAALGRVNGELHVRAASHDDHVTAACSMTAVLVVHERAYVIHAGATAAYLARNGEVVPLSGDDAFDESRLPLLARALAANATLDVTVSSTALDEGDVIVLVGRRIRGDVDRRGLLEHLEATDCGTQALIARFEHDDATPESVDRCTGNGESMLVRVVARIAAAVSFLIAMVYAR
jgi:serine/threonine protein phosphatase PrpC